MAFPSDIRSTHCHNSWCDRKRHRPRDRLQSPRPQHTEHNMPKPRPSSRHTFHQYLHHRSSRTRPSHTKNRLSVIHLAAVHALHLHQLENPVRTQWYAPRAGLTLTWSLSQRLRRQIASKRAPASTTTRRQTGRVWAQASCRNGGTRRAMGDKNAPFNCFLMGQNDKIEQNKLGFEIVALCLGEACKDKIVF
jgi:hypothetical protein